MRRAPIPARAARVALVAVLSSALVGTSAAFDAAREDVRALVAGELEKRAVPGAALVVLHGDFVWLAEGFGRLGVVSESTPVTLDTLFQLGSISKSFLAALVLELARQGRFGLDDPVGDRLPAVAHLPKSIRIRNLLNHTSGLREQFLLPGVDAGTADLSRPTDQLYALVASAPADFAAGARWSYSNTNYTLLAMLVEHVTGQPYEDVLHDGIFKPLALTSMRQCRSVPDGPNEARGHVGKRNGQVVPSPPENMNWIRGDGGLCGNAVDVARWMRALSSEQTAPLQVAAQMKVPTALADGHVADYGYALATITPDGVRRIGHNGAMLGFSASGASYPDRQLTIVLLTNHGDVRTEAIERRVARKLLRLPEPSRRPVTLSARQRRAVTGIYDIGVFDIAITQRHGKLWLESPPPGPTTALIHIGSCVFVSEAEPDANQVEVSCNGEPRLRLTMGAMAWYGTKKQ